MMIGPYAHIDILKLNSHSKESIPGTITLSGKPLVMCCFPTKPGPLFPSDGHARVYRGSSFLLIAIFKNSIIDLVVDV